MFAEQRHELILREVRERGSVRLAELADRLNVSMVTLRRDVEQLAAQGLVNRVHGGITRPDPAQEAAKGRSLTLGMLVPSAMYYFPAVIRGAREQAERLGARIVLGVSRYSDDEDRTQVKQLVDGGVEGLLLTPSRQPDASHEAWLGELSELGVPAVLVERRAELGGPASLLDAAASHHAHGAYLGTRHLAELGHRRVGLMSRRSPTAPRVRHGFLAAVDDLGLEPVHLAVEQEGPSREQVAEVVEAIRDGVTALLVHNDEDTLLLVQHLRVAGVRIPDEVSIVAYDDEVALLSDPPLTAVAPPKAAVGRCAVDLLVSRIEEGPDRAARQVALLPELRVRESTAPPR
ncbi:LacI family DNA-binding transcriptional regulator [Nonomuraea pusilla]|uniref:DNA-binding transcriptional regulator, LacI/PurR family n=1 Tax=Nonomuraea pusilla TaxID=46177 RepID=A0A1H8H324_9ACTN|nr:LacI family DNA-binding transcriptional regulator [Nonomuraea pusilla]SEN50643.1 DNA-binding transcriptional regulator, LacI/PurR family [Nonomuraea pusilla]